MITFRALFEAAAWQMAAERGCAKGCLAVTSTRAIASAEAGLIDPGWAGLSDQRRIGPRGAALRNGGPLPTDRLRPSSKVSAVKG